MKPMRVMHAEDTEIYVVTRVGADGFLYDDADQVVAPPPIKPGPAFSHMTMGVWIRVRDAAELPPGLVAAMAERGMRFEGGAR
jgi:hypothetical protein